MISCPLCGSWKVYVVRTYPTEWICDDCKRTFTDRDPVQSPLFKRETP